MNTKELLSSISNRISPVWSLENFVASNPFWGWKEFHFDRLALLLQKNEGISMYMPVSFYLNKIESGDIKLSNIEKAINDKQSNLNTQKFLEKIKKLSQSSLKLPVIPNIAQYIDNQFNTDWNDLMKNETSARLLVYFDKFGEYFPDDEKDFFKLWHRDACIDLTPEIKGLKGFRKFMKNLPDDKYECFELCISELSLEDSVLEDYLIALISQLLGWASYLKSIDWDNELYNIKTNYVGTLLVILLCWEIYFYKTSDKVKEWKDVIKQIDVCYQSESIKEYFYILSILQKALELSIQEEIITKLESNVLNIEENHKPKIQMAFCIDVRSEVIRRHIENLNNNIQTIGIAGFFGFPVKFFPVNYINGKKQCPVLIPEMACVSEVPVSIEKNKYFLNDKIISGIEHFKTKFKTSVVTGFSYVSPLGIYYSLRLLGTSLGIIKPIDNPKEKELKGLLNGKTTFDLSDVSIEKQYQMAKFALSAMDLINKPLGRLVVITGHGSESVNNPHASGLDCGACGGNSGEINAMLAAHILNKKEIRDMLRKDNINIPDDTIFIAALHNTTTDEIKILQKHLIPATHIDLITELENTIHQAAKNAREEKSSRFCKDEKVNEENILNRVKDWSQTRPEWGLAGCHSFIIAPRKISKGLDLNGKVFLHEYDFNNDKDSSLLENLMTAPMIVAMWINLQYYASCVEPEKLGAGNKTLHNPVGGLGVLEGSTGDLRIGLPIQSVHNGDEWQHIPVRLNVFIHAPISKIMSIIQKHKLLQDLINNEWLYVFVIENNKVKKVYFNKNFVHQEN